MLEACQITLKIKGIERGYAIKCEVFKWALIGLFLFNFFPFKQRYRKNASCVGFQTWIVCVEGEHADHSTNTTTAQHFLYPSTPLLPNKRNLLYSSDVVCGPNRLKFAWRHQRVKRLSIYADDGNDDNVDDGDDRKCDHLSSTKVMSFRNKKGEFFVVTKSSNVGWLQQSSDS